MLVCMPGINEWSNVHGGLTLAEVALIKASLREARVTAERLLRRADALTGKAEARYRLVAQVGPSARRVGGERHESS